MFQGLPNSLLVNAIQTALSGLTQAQITAAQTTLIPSNTVVSASPDGQDVQSGGIPVVSWTNYPAALKHANMEETWADQSLLIEYNKAFNQSLTRP